MIGLVGQLVGEGLDGRLGIEPRAAGEDAVHQRNDRELCELHLPHESSLLACTAVHKHLLQTFQAHDGHRFTLYERIEISGLKARVFLGSRCRLAIKAISADIRDHSSRIRASAIASNSRRVRGPASTPTIPAQRQISCSHSSAPAP